MLCRNGTLNDQEFSERVAFVQSFDASQVDEVAKKIFSQLFSRSFLSSFLLCGFFDDRWEELCSIGLRSDLSQNYANICSTSQILKSPILKSTLVTRLSHSTINKTPKLY